MEVVSFDEDDAEDGDDVDAGGEAAGICRAAVAEAESSGKRRLALDGADEPESSWTSAEPDWLDVAVLDEPGVDEVDAGDALPPLL